VTIHDVAREAGVSIATASRALRDRPEVRPEVRKRVQEVASRLGYRRNLVARSLKEGRTRTIALLLPDPAGNPYYGIVSEAARTRGHELGYDTFVAYFAFDLSSFLEAALHADQRRFDALVLYAPGDYCREFRNRAPDNGARAVSLDEIANSAAPTGVPFDPEVGMIAAGHLFQLGHRRIAFLCAQAPVGPGTRESGYEAFMREAGLPRRFVDSPETVRGGRAAASAVLADHDRPTAIIARNDVSAFGVLRGLHEAGVCVPADVSVVGCDNIELSAYSRPSLTTVDLRAGEVARLSVDLIISRIEGRSLGVPEGDLPRPFLVARESSGPAAGPVT